MDGPCRLRISQTSGHTPSYQIHINCQEVFLGVICLINGGVAEGLNAPDS